MHLFSRSALFLLGASVVVAAPMGSQGPGNNQTKIETIAFTGSGCPPNSVGTALSADGTTLTLIFDVYIATSGPGIATSQRLRTCDISIGVHYPPSWQCALFTADYRGFASLQQHSVGIGASAYRFTGVNELVGAQVSSSLAVDHCLLSTINCAA
jgi:hypothetical protein